MNKLLILFALISSCFSSETREKQSSESDKILVVYLSRTNNTKAVAEIIQKQVGGDLVALELEVPYPEDYSAIVKQVAKENETGFLPPLKTRVDLDKYDIIFLGFPTWGMRLPPPMKSFLHANDLSGKTLIPFNTNGGYGVGSCFQTIKELCPDSEILKGFSIRGGSERDGIYLAIKGNRKTQAQKNVDGWLKEIGMPKEK
ncbi:MAG: flavodoxin [Croceitalea sp.]|nr:flavodoxin [Croceitalea sp.]NNC33396.1 flavodoxin [Croceitalea sp.]NNL09143.1 flavodoxin [Croceitalea sp.]NNM16962.1 flavodoxin [Croceitalea sp.]